MKNPRYIQELEELHGRTIINAHKAPMGPILLLLDDGRVACFKGDPWSDGDGSTLRDERDRYIDDDGLIEMGVLTRSDVEAERKQLEIEGAEKKREADHQLYLRLKQQFESEQEDEPQ